MRKLYNAWEERDEDEEIFGNSGRYDDLISLNYFLHDFQRNHSLFNLL